MKNGTCVKCQSPTVRALETFDRSNSSRELHLVNYGDPEAIFDKEPTFYPMHAMACMTCGYVEFYLTLDPKA